MFQVCMIQRWQIHIKWTKKIYLVRDIKPPNHESCFPQFFLPIFLTLSSWKRKHSFYWSKTGFFLVLDQLKVCFIFHLVKVRKIHGKNWERQSSWMVVWCHEQDIPLCSKCYDFCAKSEPCWLLRCQQSKGLN